MRQLGVRDYGLRQIPTVTACIRQGSRRGSLIHMWLFSHIKYKQIRGRGPLRGPIKFRAAPRPYSIKKLSKNEGRSAAVVKMLLKIFGRLAAAIKKIFDLEF